MALDNAFLDFIPLFPEEDEPTIRTRWIEWANEGLSADDPRWTDTREGQMWQMCTEGGIRESAREYDLMSEVAAASFPLWSWGSYLDDHAEQGGLDRLTATFAEGVVTFEGPDTTPVPSGIRVGVEASEPGGELIEFEVITGGVIGVGLSIDLDVRAVEAGSRGNVAADAVTLLLTPIVLTTIANDDAMTGGSDTETDTALRARIVALFRGGGGANVLFYERVASNYPGVGAVTVIALWDGPNTVKVIVTDANGDPVSPATVAGLQELLDPVLGEGAGEAPVGAEVTVETATVLLVDVSATIEFEAGYSLDGFGGTFALEDSITAAIRAYGDGQPPGGEVVQRQMIRAIMSIVGVHDTSEPVLSGAGGNGNVAVPASPPRVSRIDGVTLTAGTI